MWAQEKDKLYIDLIFNLDFTVVELPVNFSKINHNTLTWETLISDSRSFGSAGGLVSEQLWSLRPKPAPYSAFEEL